MLEDTRALSTSKQRGLSCKGHPARQHTTTYTALSTDPSPNYSSASSRNNQILPFPEGKCSVVPLHEASFRCPRLVMQHPPAELETLGLRARTGHRKQSDCSSFAVLLQFYYQKLSRDASQGGKSKQCHMKHHRWIDFKSLPLRSSPSRSLRSEPEEASLTLLSHLDGFTAENKPWGFRAEEDDVRSSEQAEKTQGHRVATSSILERKRAGGRCLSARCQYHCMCQGLRKL